MDSTSHLRQTLRIRISAAQTLKIIKNLRKNKMISSQSLRGQGKNTVRRIGLSKRSDNFKNLTGSLIISLFILKLDDFNTYNNKCKLLSLDKFLTVGSRLKMLALLLALQENV